MTVRRRACLHIAARAAEHGVRGDVSSDVLRKGRVRTEPHAGHCFSVCF